MAGSRDELGLTPKQRNFAEGCANGFNIIKAYKESYNVSKMKDSTIYRKAYEEHAKPKVKQAIFKLQEKNTKRFEYTKYQHFRELEEVRLLCQKNKDTSGSYTALNTLVRATELKGKMCGHYIDKLDITSGNEPISINIIVGGK